MIVKIHLLAVPTYLISVVLGLQSLSLSKNCGALNTVILPKYYYLGKISQLHLIHTCKHHWITPDVTSNTRLSLCGDLSVLTLFFAFCLFYLIFYIFFFFYNDSAELSYTVQSSNRFEL